MKHYRGELDIDFEVLLWQPSRNVPQAVEYACLKLRKGVRAKATDVQVYKLFFNPWERVKVPGKNENLRDGAKERALKISSNHSTSGRKGPQERDKKWPRRHREKQEKVMSRNQGKRIFQKEKGVNSVERYQEVKKRPECLEIVTVTWWSGLWWPQRG